MTAVVDQVRVKLRGAPAAILQELNAYKGPKQVVEYVIDGPRGTGKTLGVGFLLYHLAYRYPGIRMLFVRKTRRSITQSFCPDWEKIVCRGTDPCLKGPAADHRSEYRFENGSVLVLAGLDDPQKAYSTNFDVVVPEEASQFTEDEVEQFHGVLRQWTPGMQFQLLLMLTNPRHGGHWIMRRVKAGKTKRYQSKHADNPKWHDGKNWTPEGWAYINSLAGMTGVRRRRLYKGEWCSAEGAVWECFDDEANFTVDTMPDNPPWYCASMDWGHTDPCSFLVAAISPKKDITIVREEYISKKSIEFWTSEVLDAYKDFGVSAVVVDPSRPEIIDAFNAGLSRKYSHITYPVARPADNVRHASNPKGDLAGLDLVRDYFEKGKIKLFAGRLRNWPDPLLVSARKATQLAEEIPEYVYWTPVGADDARDAEDHTAKNCDDHACDALRYLVQFVHNHDYSRRTERKLPEGAHPWEAADLAMLNR